MNRIDKIWLNKWRFLLTQTFSESARSDIITVFDHSHVVLRARGGVQSPLVVQINLLPSKITHQLCTRGIVRNVRGGKWSQPSVEFDLSTGQMSRNKVSHCTKGVIRTIFCSRERNHPPIVYPDVGIISSYSYQLGPAGTNCQTLDLSTTTTLHEMKLK